MGAGGELCCRKSSLICMYTWVRRYLQIRFMSIVHMDLYKTVSKHWNQVQKVQFTQFLRDTFHKTDLNSHQIVNINIIVNVDLCVQKSFKALKPRFKKFNLHSFFQIMFISVTLKIPRKPFSFLDGRRDFRHTHWIYFLCKIVSSWYGIFDILAHIKVYMQPFVFSQWIKNANTHQLYHLHSQ